MPGNGLRKLARAVAQSPQSSQSLAGFGEVMKCYSGVFIGSEAADSNLCRITIGNQTFRYVPRLGTWTSSPTSGTTILVGSIGGNLLVLGTQLGDTSKAKVP